MALSQSGLTEGSVAKKMLLFALPILVGNIFQRLYNSFDSWVVGAYLGDNALAAVSSSASLINLMIGFFNGVALGAGAVISRHYGARDYTAVRKSIHTTVALGLVAGLVLTVLGVCLTPLILRWMQTPPDVLPESISYFRYYFCGALFIVTYNFFVGIFHAVGDSRHPLYYLIISSVVNVILDLLFVGVLRFGVGSAAIATTISQGLSALLCFVQLVRTKEVYSLRVREIRFHKIYLTQLLHIGIPSGIQNSVISLANVFVQSNINSFGKFAVAGCGAYSKLEGFVFLPIECFTHALATFVGQNLGAQKLDRVKKGVRFGMICGVSIAELIGITCYIFARPLLSIFSNTPEVLSFGIRHMRTICLFYCLLSFTHCTTSVLRGAGISVKPMLVSLGCWCVFRVAYISVAVRIVNELTTISWAYPITWTLSSCILLVSLLRGDYLRVPTKIKVKET